MEAHTHTHTPRKKWTHYLFEFFMLFLAVFCGFLAEYQLEHKIEKEKERQYIQSLISDLKEDVVTLENNVDLNKKKIILLDSLLNIISDAATLKEKQNDAYYMARVGPRIITLTLSSKTFDQLKNSGGFRLLTKKEVANKVMEYYNQLPMIKKLEDLYFEEFSHYKELAAKIFNPITFRSMENADGTVARGTITTNLRISDQQLLNEFGVFIVYMNGTIRSIVPLEEKLKEDGLALIQFLQSKY